MRRSIQSALVLTLGLAGSTACVEEDPSVFIEGVLPILPDACEVSAADQVFLPSGRLDLGAAGVGAYRSFLKVRTNLPATFNNQDNQQSRQRTPNFPNYGSADNNIITMKESRLEISISGRVDQLQALADLGSEQLSCNADACTFTQDAVAPATGSVFNQQQNLSTPAAIATELLPAAQASALADLISQDLPGIMPKGPSDTLTVNVAATLVGNTSGNGALRDTITLPFPFTIEVCFGCLQPSQETCDLYATPGTSQPFPAPPADERFTCFAGQDIGVNACTCADGSLVDANGCT